MNDEQLDKILKKALTPQRRKLYSKRDERRKK